MSCEEENAQEKRYQLFRWWKKAYIERLIDDLKPFGDVLEVGFDLGNAAKQIQNYNPKSHTIIENDPKTANEAKAFANKHATIKVIQENWRTALPKLGTFDTIFFNDYPSDSELEVILRLNKEEVTKASDKAKELLNLLESQFSQVKVQFSDQDIDQFCQKIGQQDPQTLLVFFKKLKEKGNINQKQFEKLSQKLNLSLEKEAAKKNVSNSTQEPMLTFLEECLKNHMHKGSRFSCFLSNITSKYEDPNFFDHIITNPNLNYQEQIVKLDIPDSKQLEALVIIIEKY